MGVGPLRVCNDDRLIPGGIGHPGAIQPATLGSGMEHSERNGSPDEPMRFLQLWMLPDTASLPPSAEQRQFTRRRPRRPVAEGRGA